MIPQTFLVKDGEAQMQLHAGDRYQVQPGSLLRFGAVTCRVEFSQQPAPAADDGRVPSEATAAAAQTVLVDPDATQVRYNTSVHAHSFSDARTKRRVPRCMNVIVKWCLANDICILVCR